MIPPLSAIGTRGYRNTTIQDIAKKADVSKGVIYYHFNSREELLSTIWAALIEELFEYRRERVEKQTSAREMMRAYVTAYFEFVAKNHNKFIALFAMGIDLSPSKGRTFPWSQEINERCFNYLSGILEAGQSSAEFRKFPVAEVAPIIQGALDGLCLQWIATPDLVDFERSCQVLTDLIDQYTSGTNG